MGHDDRTTGVWQPEATRSIGAGFAGSLRIGTRILCISEDMAYAEREIVPPLRNAGLMVDVAQVGATHMGQLLERSYQLVLFDINSRNGPGYSACAQMRSSCSIPLMLVLHGAAREEVLRGFQSGADAYVLAPCDPRELLARIAGLLRREATHTPCV